MASGKSLELASIGRRQPSPKCICGAAWNDHLRKDGKVLAKYNNKKHAPLEQTSFITRAARRRMKRGARNA